MASQGITGPDEVEEGSTGEIEVDVQGDTQITVTVSNTGEELVVDVDADGKARFKLPSTARAGSYLLLVGASVPTLSHEIEVTPGSNH